MYKWPDPKRDYGRGAEAACATTTVEGRGALEGREWQATTVENHGMPTDKWRA